jgi:hypothetical protein
MDTEILELKLTKLELNSIILTMRYFDFLNNNIYNNILSKALSALKKIKDDEIKHCPFCGRLPEPELFSHNSIKPDSWYIYCDCGKVSIKDCETLEDTLIEWNKRV